MAGSVHSHSGKARRGSDGEIGIIWCASLFNVQKLIHSSSHDSGQESARTRAGDRVELAIYICELTVQGDGWARSGDSELAESSPGDRVEAYQRSGSTSTTVDGSRASRKLGFSATANRRSSSSVGSGRISEVYGGIESTFQQFRFSRPTQVRPPFCTNRSPPLGVIRRAQLSLISTANRGNLSSLGETGP